MAVLSTRRRQRHITTHRQEEHMVRAAAQPIPLTRSGHVVIGVDTHKQVHVAAAMDSIGGVLATLTIATERDGFSH
jgi:hypothetical protein